MHQLHCLRNIRKCSGCGQPFPVKEFDAHVAESAGTPAALLAATSTGQLDRLTVFLQHGASVNVPCNEDTLDAPLHVAVRVRRADAVQFLLQAGAAVNAGNRSGDTALHVACQLAASNKGRPSTSSVAAEDAKEGEADSSKIEAVASIGSATIAELIGILLAAGCDVDARNILGDSPLQLLQRSQNLELALMLTSSGGSLRPVRNYCV
jgi:ankyrin repeat protein